MTFSKECIAEYKHHTKLDSIKANVNLQAWTGKPPMIDSHIL